MTDYFAPERPLRERIPSPAEPEAPQPAPPPSADADYAGYVPERRRSYEPPPASGDPAAPLPKEAPAEQDAPAEPAPKAVPARSRRMTLAWRLVAALCAVAVVTVAGSLVAPRLEALQGPAAGPGDPTDPAVQQPDHAPAVSHTLVASAEGWAAETSTPLIVRATGVDDSGLEVSETRAFPAEGTSAWDLPSGELTLHFISPINADGSAFEVPADVTVSEPREIYVMLAPMTEAQQAEGLAAVLDEIEVAVADGVETDAGDGGAALLRTARENASVADLSVIVDDIEVVVDPDAPTQQDQPAAATPSAPTQEPAASQPSVGTQAQAPQQGSSAPSGSQATSGSQPATSTGTPQGPSASSGSPSSGSQAQASRPTTSTTVEHTHVWTEVTAQGDPIYVDGDPIYVDGAPIYSIVDGREAVTGYQQILVGYQKVLAGYEQVTLGYKCYSCGSTKAP